MNTLLKNTKRIFKLKNLSSCMHPDFLIVQHKNGFKHTMRKSMCERITPAFIYATGEAINIEKTAHLDWWNKTKNNTPANKTETPQAINGPDHSEATQKQLAIEAQRKVMETRRMLDRLVMK